MDELLFMYYSIYTGMSDMVGRMKANLNHQLKRIDSAGNPINMALVKLSLEWEQECVSIRKEQS